MKALFSLVLFFRKANLMKHIFMMVCLFKNVLLPSFIIFVVLCVCMCLHVSSFSSQVY